jgi:hypothetical protein
MASALQTSYRANLTRRPLSRPTGIISLRAERYRVRAAECDQAAKKFSDPESRTLYLDLAQQWRDLARQVEMLEREQSER